MEIKNNTDIEKTNMENYKVILVDDEEEVIGHLHVVRGDLQGHEQGGEDASPQQFPTIGEHNACYGGRHVGKGDELPDVSCRNQNEEVGREGPHDAAQACQPCRYAECP